MWNFFLIFSVTYITGVSISGYQIYKLKGKGYEEYGYKTALNPVKWASFAYGYIFKTLLPKHVIEQLVLRYYDEDCKTSCYDAPGGKCKHCGCDAIAKASVPFESCSGGNWGPMIMSKEKYQKQREEFPVKIEIKYGRV